MNKDEKDLEQKLGEIISVEKICNSNIKNVLEGEFNYNKKKYKSLCNWQQFTYRKKEN